MNNFFEQLKKQARNIRLTPGEKQAMRVRLYEAMRESPASVVPEIAKPARATPSPYFFFSPKWAGAFALVLIVALGSGTAFAAQGALPGDPLYPVKINVDENVETALAVTSQAKAEVNASLAEERLTEAEALAAQNKLTASTSEELAANFDEHAQAAQTVADNLQTTNPAAAAQLDAQFDSSLTAHNAILTELGSDSNSTTTDQSSNALEAHIRMHERNYNGGNNASSTTFAINPGVNINTFVAFNPQASTSTSGAFSTSSPAGQTASSTQAASTTPKNKYQSNNQQSIAAGLETDAASALTTLQADYQSAQSTLSSTTVSAVAARIAMIEAAQAAGTASFNAGDYAGASQSFTQSLRMSTELDTFIIAGNKFNNKTLLPSLLGTFSGENGTDNTATSGGGRIRTFGPVSRPTH